MCSIQQYYVNEDRLVVHNLAQQLVHSDFNSEMNPKDLKNASSGVPGRKVQGNWKTVSKKQRVSSQSPDPFQIKGILPQHAQMFRT